MVQAQKVTADLSVLTTLFPIPGYANLPINAYVLKAQQPVLFDTGAPLDGSGADATESFMAALREVIDPADLRWLWLTHADMDHVACVRQVLEEAPQARIVTTFLTTGRMSLYQPLPLDRLYLLNPGQSLDVGDRILTSVRPPTFDAADTAGAYDSKSRAFFCADCFGGLLSAGAPTANELPEEARRQGQLLWATVDAPWLHNIDTQAFAATLDRVRLMDPEWLLSVHLPPARGMTEEFLRLLADVPSAQPFVGPDQSALQAMLAGA